MVEQMAQQMSQNPDLLRQTLDNPYIQVSFINYDFEFHFVVSFYTIQIAKTIENFNNSSPLIKVYQLHPDQSDFHITYKTEWRSDQFSERFVSDNSIMN